ncbi:hypothetical protein CYMTET_56698 [Cymbomonas tetramitiformis]|uniref:Uncharacterized protein n=1 Tax=Cymbomonas tetramitiformis TaxID=36881 RepID=A0AAE0BAT3_9CHLO|nr:hypothetical protein CYMTET_56698 [Cymbomonas tetramitiformis]
MVNIQSLLTFTHLVRHPLARARTRAIVQKLPRNAKRNSIQCKITPANGVSEPSGNSVNRGGIAQAKPEIAGFKDEERAVVRSVEAALGQSLPNAFFFTESAELWTGRTAMTGIVCCAVVDAWTQKGILQQLGFSTPNPTLLTGLLLSLGSSLTLATVWTWTLYYSGKMKVGEVRQYCGFLGIDAEMIECVRTEQADWLPLGLFDVSDATPLSRITEANLKSVSQDSNEPALLDQQKIREAPLYWIPEDEVDRITTAEDLKEAQDFELLGARCAMIGFLVTLIIEAATGNGLVSQFMLYADYLN